MTIRTNFNSPTQLNNQHHLNDFEKITIMLFIILVVVLLTLFVSLIAFLTVCCKKTKPTIIGFERHSSIEGNETLNRAINIVIK